MPISDHDFVFSCSRRSSAERCFWIDLIAWWMVPLWSLREMKVIWEKKEEMDKRRSTERSEERKREKRKRGRKERKETWKGKDTEGGKRERTDTPGLNDRPDCRRLYADPSGQILDIDFCKFCKVYRHGILKQKHVECSSSFSHVWFKVMEQDFGVDCDLFHEASKKTQQKLFPEPASSNMVWYFALLGMRSIKKEAQLWGGHCFEDILSLGWQL